MSTESPATPVAPGVERKPKDDDPTQPAVKNPLAETGGPKGPEPTRFGDWERNGRCVDF